MTAQRLRSSNGKNRTTKQVAFLFNEGGPASPAILGGKGAGLASLTQLAVPVPPGFTVTTTVARAFVQHGRTPKRLAWQLSRGIQSLECATGKVFGGSQNPLLVSVRSGAAVSMPGMMDTVLNLGLNPAIVASWGEVVGMRFALDCYRRFLAMYGEVVLGVPKEFFEGTLACAKEKHNAGGDLDLDIDLLQAICDEYRGFIEDWTKSPVDDDPRLQLERALVAVLKSWDTPRAKVYRRAQKIPNDLGTAVNIQTMVFGNRDHQSGTGVVFSHNPASGEPGLWGEFLCQAQGEDVVAGSRTPMPISQMQKWNLGLYHQLDDIVSKLENHFRHVVDVEFTVESGRLFILQTRQAKLSPEAQATIACRKVWAKKFTKPEALATITPEQLKVLESQGFDPQVLQKATAVGRAFLQGLPASHGAAVGRVVFSSQEAVEAVQRKEAVILVREDTSPDDLPGMLAASAVVTFTGGTTSHAAVVARALGKPAVVDAEVIFGASKRIGLGLREGRMVAVDVQTGATLLGKDQIISVDGQTGMVFSGAIPLATTQRKKEVNLFLRWRKEAEGKTFKAPRLDFTAVDQSVSLHQLINDFYLTDQMAQEAEGTSLALQAAQLRTQVHVEAAERLATYLVVAIGGEVHHADQLWLQRPDLLALNSLVREFKIPLKGMGEQCRIVPETLAILRTGDHACHLRFLELASTLFQHSSWRGTSYGGQAWAAIAQAAHDFLTGKLNHSVFADHAFDLHHNTGSVFGKHSMLDGRGDYVKLQLDLKKQAKGTDELHVVLRQFIKGLQLKMGLSQTDLNSFRSEVEQLYCKGWKLRLWRGGRSSYAAPFSFA